jgi:predicted transglutaminase-like cysteine proteinase
MIKKLIISAVVLTALISAKESNAAGVGGFARVLSSAAAVEVAESRAVVGYARNDESPLKLTFAQQTELLKINSGVNAAIYQVDDYLDLFNQVAVEDKGPKSCFDCADIKRDKLVELGWSAKAMKISYAINGNGHVERVLVVGTDGGDVILGNDSPMIDMSGLASSTRSRAFQPGIARPYYDL